MANKENYQIQMEQVIQRETGRRPRLLLHACCAPCSSASLERVAPYFDVTVFYYNPNITDEAEYRIRVEEEKRLIDAMPLPYPIGFLEGAYEPERFLTAARGLEREPEGGARCMACFALRLSEAVTTAEALGFDYVATTLTISPLKNADALNRIGSELAAGKRVQWLPTDFKKKNGYKRSIDLSREYGLYRQNFCGCEFSRAEAAERDASRQEVTENHAAII